MRPLTFNELMEREKRIAEKKRIHRILVGGSPYIAFRRMAKTNKIPYRRDFNPDTEEVKYFLETPVGDIEIFIKDFYKLPAVFRPLAVCPSQERKQVPTVRVQHAYLFSPEEFVDYLHLGSKEYLDFRCRSCRVTDNKNRNLLADILVRDHDLVMVRDRLYFRWVVLVKDTLVEKLGGVLK